ncbi:phospholipid carrier-dependent glycosyltransferase [Nocardia sp. CT2-14]|uniref:Phospholipid carrier-dependent glycosyltransferase n=2 Tax=Nocardia aurantiaca TaxID=2675850 RepID=A0A6I3L733_9NOCA|nr:phospholipid carrier-dependent glycosyltransferase [Nocardia aurantiaca]
MGNSFYAAAAWSGSQDWKALLFGSLDPGNFITVDKPPVSQWVMGLSGQLFGFSSASMLAPQAVMAVGAVALMYGAVTRVTSSRGAGLLAGLVLAVTPVVALMFRFNNPDAVMVLLMTAAAYCTVRALPRASLKWIVLTGVALGFAFLAKMLEGLMVLPALGLAYVIVAPTTLRNRLLHSLAALGALIVSSGWYVLLTILWPADSRPYLAGSKDNTFMDLVLGYNGFARYLGKNHMGGSAKNPFELPEGYEIPKALERGGFGGGFGSGPDRMFTGEIAFEISWLLPAALLAFVLVLVSRGRRPRTDLVRGAALVYGLWLVIDGVLFSAMKSGMHAYYTLAVAPAIAGCIAVGVYEVWRRRAEAFGRVGGAALILSAGIWGFALLQRNSDWQPWLRWTVLAITVITSLGLIVLTLPPAARWDRLRGRATTVLLTAGVIAGLAGTTAYAAATLPESHTGGGPTVGPAQPKKQGPADQFREHLETLFGGQADPQLVALLQKTDTKWSAAIDRSSPAAGLELASRTSVLAIGGFTSADPVPTLPQFEDLVRNHEITYYLVPEIKLPDAWRVDPKPADSPTPAHPDPQQGIWRPAGNKEILDWVTAHYTATQHFGDMAVYDLTGQQR